MAQALIRHEIHAIYSNRRFILSMVLQLLILFAILPVFATFLSTGTVSLTTPALNEFVPIAIVDNSRDSSILRNALHRSSKLDITYSEKFSFQPLENGYVAGILVLPPGYDESLNRVLEVELYTAESSMKKDMVYDAIFPAISEASEIISKRRSSEFGVSVEDPVKIEKEYLRPLVIDEGESRFSGFFLAYLVPLMLFFPIFTVGSIVLDSVVGERERKNVESLIVAPVSRGQMVSSKFLASSIFVFVQLLLWLAAFQFYGVPLENKAAILLMVMLVDSAVISTAILMAYYAKSVKEANILLMLLYTAVFITLIVSLSLNYFNTTISTPFAVISSLVIGEQTQGLPWIAAMLAYTVAVLHINKRLVERDDILFGPRPSITTLLEDLSVWLFSFGKMGYLYLTMAFAAPAIAYSMLIEVSIGILVIFTFGFTNILIPLFAMVEELVKPLGIYLLASRKGLRDEEGIILGVLSGVAFFMVESVSIALITYYLFPSMLMEVFKLRVATTLVIHAVSSGIVGYGIAVKERFLPAVMLATIIHSAFNLTVTGGVL